MTRWVKVRIPKSLKEELVRLLESKRIIQPNGTEYSMAEFVRVAIAEKIQREREAHGKE